MINVPSEADHPERCNIVVDVGRFRRVRLRIAADMDELARARIIEELEQAHVDRNVRAEPRRRLAESPLAFPAQAAASDRHYQALHDFEKER